MSDSIEHWLTSDQLLLVITDVHGRQNVQTIVSKAGKEYRLYTFVDHPTGDAGPVDVDEYPLPTEDIISALEKERVVTVNSPESVKASWTCERVRGVPVSMIDEIRVRDHSGSEFVLTSEGADYPTSLLLKYGDTASIRGRA